MFRDAGKRIGASIFWAEDLSIVLCSKRCQPVPYISMVLQDCVSIATHFELEREDWRELPDAETFACFL